MQLFLLALTLRMVNGTPESDFEATVAVMTPTPAYDGVYLNCTGSVIAPQVVLTAAHCVEGVDFDRFVAGQVHFGQDAFDPDDIRLLSDAAVHPSYVFDSDPRNDPNTWDFATVILTSDAPVRATRLRNEPLDDGDLGEPLVSVGYGQTEYGGGGSIGDRLSTELTLEEVRGNVLVAWSDTAQGEGHVCSGDSGGPQYGQDGLDVVQWAVHQWSDPDCTGAQGSTRVDVAMPWILDQVEAVHGTRDLCEANGWYGDGECDDYCEAVDPDCDTTTGSTDTGVTDTGLGDTTGDPSTPEDEESGGCGCSTSGGGAQMWMLLAILALLRRYPVCAA